MAKNVLVFGATGVIGQYIVQALVDAKDSFGKIGVFTSQNTVQNKANEINSLKSNGVEVIVGDVQNEKDVSEAYKDYDTIVSAVGRNVIAHQIDLIRIAEQAPSVKRFYPSEYGTDIDYYPHSVNEKPHQLKLKVRAYIKENVKKLDYTYLVTGPYPELYVGKMAGDEREKAGSFNVQTSKAVLLGTGDDKVSFTAMPDVGKLLVASLQHPEASRNRALKVNSFTTTPNEILSEFEKQTGKKWEVHYTSLDELKQIEKEMWEKGDPLATVYTLRRIWTEGGTLYDKRDNDFVGNPPTKTLPEIVKGAVEKESVGFRSGDL